MALILKENKTYNFKGIELTEIYGVIDQINMNKRDKIAHIVFEIYPNKNSRKDQNKLLSQYNYDLTSDKFDEYFSIDNLDEQNQYAKSYKYLLEVREIIEEPVDGEQVLGDLVWGNLQSDE